MRLCTKGRILDLIQSGDILVKNIDIPEHLFLDDVRVGLRLRDHLLEVCGPVNLQQPLDSISHKKIALRDASLIPGKFYIGLSQEEFCLANDIMGFICTRSKYARTGFELAKSSVFVIPGFGNGTPTPIVFEISPDLEIYGLDTSDKYAFMLLFELSDGINLVDTEYGSRFPFMLF